MKKNSIIGQEYVKTDMSGMVSYKIDGLEEKLTPENIENLTEEELKSYNLKTGQLISASSDAGKVVNNYECYIVTFLASNEAQNAKVRANS